MKGLMNKLFGKIKMQKYISIHKASLLLLVLILIYPSSANAQYCVLEADVPTEQTCVEDESYIYGVEGNGTIKCAVPRIHTSAACVSPFYSQVGGGFANCTCARGTALKVQAPCTVTSTGGDSCTAGSAVYMDSSFTRHWNYGSCCLCFE